MHHEIDPVWQNKGSEHSNTVWMSEWKAMKHPCSGVLAMEMQKAAISIPPGVN